MLTENGPNISYRPVEDLIGENDKVAARWTARGTHRSDFKGIPATGRAVTVSGTDIFGIAGDRIVETWVSSDLLGLMRQIGAVA
jgi:predicted ester cyclase